MEKEEFFIKRIRELANLSYRRDIVTFSDFLNLNEQNIVNNRKNQIPGVVAEGFGGYEQAERQMIAFHPDALAFTWEYPITCLKAEPKAKKFSEDLGHRDYLGAILNLGIDRSVIGDILIQDYVAWIFCHNKIADFLIENLSSRILTGSGTPQSDCRQWIIQNITRSLHLCRSQEPVLPSVWMH